MLIKLFNNNRYMFTKDSNLWSLKARLILEVGIVVSSFYFLLQYFPLFGVYQMPLSNLDSYIPFNDQFIWCYQSLYLLIFYRAATFKHAHELINFASVFSLAAIISCCIFLLFPTMCARPNPAHTNWLYKSFIAIEKPLNAFPSMHVSLVLVTCAFSLIDVNYSNYIKGVVLMWALIIIYSTLSTKQHVLADVIGGLIVWGLSHLLTNKFRPLRLLEKRWNRLYVKKI